MVNEQLTERIAATLLIVLVKKLPFLCLSPGPQEAQAEQCSLKAVRELGAATKSPEPLPEHGQVLAAASGEAGVCDTVTEGVTAESPLQNLSAPVISSHPFEQCQKKPSSAPFPYLCLFFSLLYSFSRKSVPWSLSWQIPEYLGCTGVLRNPGRVLLLLKRHWKLSVGEGSI